MDWQAALRKRLVDDTPLATIVGTKVDWAARKQGDPAPAVNMMLISDGGVQTLAGFQGLQPSRVQFDSYGLTHKEAWDLTVAVIAAAVPGVSANGHKFSRAMFDLPPRDLPERVTALDGTNKTVFRVSMDLRFHHAIDEEAS